MTGYTIPELMIGGSGRERDGVIVSIRHEHTGQRRSLHRAGASQKAVLEIAEQIDALGPGWKIVALSTAASIYRDLQGTRYNRIEDGSRHGSYDPRTAEASLLGRIGRLDLLSPLANQSGVMTA